MPGIKGRGKRLSFVSQRCCSEHFQFNACLKLRVVRQITGNDLLLMEVAHLDGYIDKDLSVPPAFHREQLP